MKEVFLTTTDNIKISINHYSNSNDTVVIICPGWFMTKDAKAFLKLSDDLSKHFDVISMNFRGHGNSGGFYSFTSNEEKDLEVVVNFAKDLNYKNICLLGFSLGGALVLLYGAKHSEISKIIAVSAPTEFFKIENKIYSPDAWIPTLFHKFEPFRWLTIRPTSPFLPKQKPIDFVQNIKTPTLFIAGEKDPTVLPWHTETLFQKATCKKDYKVFKNTRHAEDLYMVYPQEFLQICTDWILI